MVEKSEIVSHLDKERATALKFSETEGYEYAASNVLRTLGYFSLIGISRVKILTGDYEGTAGRGFPNSANDQGLSQIRTRHVYSPWSFALLVMYVPVASTCDGCGTV